MGYGTQFRCKQFIDNSDFTTNKFGFIRLQDSGLVVFISIYSKQTKRENIDATLNQFQLKSFQDLETLLQI